MKKAVICLSLCLLIVGCAKDGNLKEAAYETVRGINNMHHPVAPGENRQNELSYREYQQKRSDAQHDDLQRNDSERREQQQSPEWLIDPNR